MSLECAHESSCFSLSLYFPLSVSLSLVLSLSLSCSLHLAPSLSYPRGNNGAEFSMFANFDDSPNGKVLLMRDKCATICENDVRAHKHFGGATFQCRFLLHSSLCRMVVI